MTREGPEETPIWMREIWRLTNEEHERLYRTQTPQNSEALREVIRLHTQWVETNGREGARIELSVREGTPPVNLSAIGLGGTTLDGAVLTRASMQWANLSGVDLKKGSLRQARLDDIQMGGGCPEPDRAEWRSFSTTEEQRATARKKRKPDDRER